LKEIILGSISLRPLKINLKENYIFYCHTNLVIDLVLEMLKFSNKAHFFHILA